MMFNLKTFILSTSVTSSPGSASGATPCAALDGPTTSPSGPAPAPASPSAPPESRKASPTRATSGLSGSGSLTSATLQSCLESKLRARSIGSILYRLTWKARTTPSGRAICALRASAVRISDSASTLSDWPTPNAMGGGQISRGGTRKGEPLMGGAAQLCGWPTPTTRNHKDGAECPNVPVNALLGRAVWAVGWTTPQAHDVSGRSEGQKAIHGTKHGCACLVRDAAMAGWPTPTSKEAAGGEYADPEKALARVQGPHSNDLRDFAKIAIPTRLCSDGTLLTGSTAGMASGGRLNPAHSRWLMRLPPEWDACAPTETRSTRKRPASSSER